MEKSRPYVGVTGATNSEEVALIRESFTKNGITLDGNHIPMIGFLVSYKTLHGEAVKNRRYPRITSLAGLLGGCRHQLFTTIHYNTREIDTLEQQIKDLISRYYHDNLCRGLQLNISWESIKQLCKIGKIKDYLPNLQIILQLKKSVMDSGIQGTLDFLSHCQQEISYVLLDPSEGVGKKLDIESAVKLYNAINSEYPHIGVGFAGGFTADNIHGNMAQFYQGLLHKDFSVDAESGLRDKLGDGYGNDVLNADKVGAYIHNSARFLGSNK